MREFFDAMRAAGLEPVKLPELTDGRLARFRVVGDKAGSRNGWAVRHRSPILCGTFGSWRTGESHSWRAEMGRALAPQERAELRLRFDEAQKARAAEEATMRAEAAARAGKLWGLAKPATDAHPYLVGKKVRAYGVRQLRERLVIPARDVDGTLHSLQFIGPDGRKTFLTGGRKRGCYYAIGRPDGALCICEGYATGATIFQETGHATAIAFDAGNLQPVAEALRRKFPGLMLVIAADNDCETDGNPGVTSATAAARAVGAALAVPSFGGAAHV